MAHASSKNNDRKQSSENSQPPTPQPAHHQSSFLPPVALVSTCEEMNPQRRCAFEDCACYAPAGTWDAPDPHMAFLCICDGHGGRQMVEYLEDGLLFHVSAELNAPVPDNGGEEASRENHVNTSRVNVLQRLEQAFLMADIHSKTLGVTTSGATVAVCLITRYDSNTWKIYAANAGDARVVLGHEGKAHRMTKDHRTDDPEEVRRIEETGGFLFKGRVLGVLAVTRSLGDHCMKEYVIAKPYTKERTIVKDPRDDGSFVM
jgi:serine/threonine protein phosphatase PrpC